MEHDSNLKFNTCKLKKRNKGQNKYNLVNHKKIKVRKAEKKYICACILLEYFITCGFINT